MHINPGGKEAVQVQMQVALLLLRALLSLISGSLCRQVQNRRSNRAPVTGEEKQLWFDEIEQQHQSSVHMSKRTH